MSAHVPPFAVQAGEGESLEAPTGDVVTIKAHTRNTNGSMSVHEIAIAPMSGPALHTHLREDELWWRPVVRMCSPRSGSRTGSTSWARPSPSPTRSDPLCRVRRNPVR
jgi:hypothetical protein